MNTSTSLLRRAGQPSKNIIFEDAITPPMASRSRSSSVDSFDEEYFSKTYVPLSNLPTPPLSSHSDASSREDSLESLFCPGEYLDPALLGPAIHLTNLIPSSTSLTPASTPLTHAILTRASLSLETIALAVSILDSLNSRFALQWRKSCPLDTPTQTYTYFPEPPASQHRHIDSINPALIPLSALILAVKFLDDEQQSTRQYVNSWARNMWSCEQVNFTQWCIMENLGWRLLPLWDESIIIGALEDMERAAAQVAPFRPVKEGWEEEFCLGELKVLGERGMSNGSAVFGLGEQITPADSPGLENIRGINEVDVATRDAFENGNGKERFRLNGDCLEEFPVYVDMFGGLEV